MRIDRISEKQAQIFDFVISDDYALICDGSVRSGKTVMMASAFVIWAMEFFDRTNFAICGKTVQSAERNVLMPLRQNESLPYTMSYKVTSQLLTVKCGEKENYFYLFGGRDESSYMLIQGITLAGVMFDEAALMPKSFVNQAMARCISYEKPKYFFNCNPESPAHWFYEEWIEKPKEHTRHIHFTLEDNPALTQTMIERTKALYTGIFYRRYILGQWVHAEGLVYSFGEENITDEIPAGGEYFISIDYGTLNPFSAGLWCVLGAKAVRIKEFYYSGRGGVQRTDEDYCSDIDALAGGREIKQVIVDPSAASFITALRRRGYRVRQANNEVLDGIRRTAVYLRDGNIKICRSCVDSIREFGLYRWEEHAAEDKVVKENDHAMDDIRYFCNTVMRGRIRNGQRDRRNVWMM